MSSLVLQLPGREDPAAILFSMLGLLIFGMFLFYGVRIQLAVMLWRLGKYVKRVEGLSRRATERLVGKLKAYYEGDESQLRREVRSAINTFAVRPISLDPHKIVPKLDHVLRLRDKSIEEVIDRLASRAGDVDRKNLSNLLELTIELENIRKILGHYYISAKRNRDLIALSYMQIYLPFLMEIAEALGSGVEAFVNGRPIGDSLGPMVVYELAKQTGSRPRPIAEDTVYYDMVINDRRVIGVRAKGPGGTVGRLGDALEKLLDIYPGTKLIVTVDAALKLEGEETGSIAEGVGVAMGGPGTDRYVIETIASRRKIPIYAIIVKMSEREAVSEMNKKVRESVEKAVGRFKRLLNERTKAYESVILVGVGNTIGVNS